MEQALLLQVFQRVSVLETLVGNHLKTHEMLLWTFIVPMAIGIGISIIQNLVLTKKVKQNNKKGE